MAHIHGLARKFIKVYKLKLISLVCGGCMELIVLSVGGSVICPDLPDHNYVRRLSVKVKELSKKYKLIIVIGGGKTARNYTNALKKLGACDKGMHETGILATMLNAKFVIEGFKTGGVNVCSELITGKDFVLLAKNKLKRYSVLIGCGTVPFITTDTDAAILADKLNAKRLINVSNVLGVYDKDPNKFKNAKKFNELGFKQFSTLISKSATGKPGENIIFDNKATKIVCRSKIESHFVNSDLQNITRAVQGKKHNGTVLI